MKKTLSILLVLIFVVSLVACNETTVLTNEYKISEDYKPGSVIDDVMTDISNKDDILEKTTASFCDKGVLYEVNIRQYTEEGTFKAFEKQLQRLKDTGVNILWFMPIHPISEVDRKGTLGSYYSVKDYMDVNPEFGSMNDFKHLVNKAHDMGFKVILDWVANHTGWDNKWITEHPDYYVHDKNGEIESPSGWSDVAQLDYSNYEMRYEMIKCMQYWVEEVKVDGFRCDYASGVPASFWNAAVYKLKSINREIFMLAEAGPSEMLTHYAFDACYNDTLYFQMGAIRPGIAPKTLEQGMVKNTNFPDGSFPMNYLDNHDKNSYDGSIVERYEDAYVPLAALLFIAPGMPMLYTGNEMLSDQSLEFFEKDTLKEGDYVLQDFFKSLSDIKAKNMALDSTNADVDFIDTSSDKVFAFSRTKDDNTVLFIGNMYYEDIDNCTVTLPNTELNCVMYYDGSEKKFDPVLVDQSYFKNKTFKAYEFYIITLKTPAK